MTNSKPTPSFCLALEMPLCWVAAVAVMFPAALCGEPVVGPETAEDFFRPAHVWNIHLELSPEDFDALEPDERGRRERSRFDLDFEYVRGRVTIGDRSSQDVGVRYKGNSSFMASRGILKRSFKLDFNRFQKAQKFVGLKKLNLNNNILDPSQLRETLAYGFFRRAAVPASRTTFARVYLTVPDRHDRRYVGLYTVVEQVGAAFLNEHFGSRDGLILKPERSQAFPHFDADWKEYERVYVPKTDVTPAAAIRLFQFTHLVSQADDEEFRSRIDEFIDLDEFTRFIAVHTVLSHLDSILLRGHNFFIVLPAETKRFRWIPWDVNSTFAGHTSAGRPSDQMNLSINHPFARGNRLLERLLSLDKFRERYREQVRRLMDSQFSPKAMNDKLARLRKVIEDAVREDRHSDYELFTASFQRTPSDQESRSAPRRDERRPGGPRGPRTRGKPRLADFVALRRDSIEAQFAGEREGFVPRLQQRRRGAGPRNRRRPGPPPGTPQPPPPPPKR